MSFPVFVTAEVKRLRPGEKNGSCERGPVVDGCERHLLQCLHPPVGGVFRSACLVQREGQTQTHSGVKIRNLVELLVDIY